MRGTGWDVVHRPLAGLGLINRAAEGAPPGTGTRVAYGPIAGTYNLLPNDTLGQVMDVSLRRVGGGLRHSAADSGSGIGYQGAAVAARTLVPTATQLFANPAPIASARAEFGRRRGADFRYRSLLDRDSPALDCRRLGARPSEATSRVWPLHMCRPGGTTMERLPTLDADQIAATRCRDTCRTPD